jgi:hypothetical protein
MHHPPHISRVTCIHSALHGGSLARCGRLATIVRMSAKPDACLHISRVTCIHSALHGGSLARCGRLATIVRMSAKPDACLHISRVTCIHSALHGGSLARCGRLATIVRMSAKTDACLHNASECEDRHANVDHTLGYNDLKSMNGSGTTPANCVRHAAGFQ